MELSVREAAAALDVGERRVRQLIDAGRVRARRVGSVWLVDSTSLPVASRRGRPMSPTVAWTFLTSPTAPTVRPDRWRERRARLLADHEPGLLLASWTAARARRELFVTREPDGLLSDPRVVRSGVSDPRSGLSAAHLSEGYVTEADLTGVRRTHLLRPAAGAPSVILHVVDTQPPDPAPLLVLAADLADHEGARELARARELIVEALDR